MLLSPAASSLTAFPTDAVLPSVRSLHWRRLSRPLFVEFTLTLEQLAISTTLVGHHLPILVLLEIQSNMAAATRQITGWYQHSYVVVCRDVHCPAGDVGQLDALWSSTTKIRY
ncbi:hypothetical protein PC116_g23396 [Phytophthora cactorum]|nr:hypothetical protein PC116_g23396 [Phytophthora cactorum]